MADDAHEKQSGLYRPLIATAVIGAILYTFDALVLGQGGIIVLGALLGILVALVRMGGALAKKGGAKEAGVHAIALVMWIGLAIGTFVSIRVQARISRSRAETVIAACEAYRTDNGVYPDELSRLVPRYLARVPRARLALTADTFDYYVFPASAGERDSHTTLMWTTIPPFGHGSYTFETKHWGSAE